jgi:zinc transporter
MSGAGTPEETRHLGWQIANLHRYLTPLRILVDRLIAVRPGWLTGAFLPRLNAIAQNLRGHEADLENLLQRLGPVRDHLSDRSAVRMNEILYVLTIVSSIMLPLTFITGLLGINVGIAGASYSGMSSTLAFLIICAILAVIAGLEYMLFVRRNVLMRPPVRKPRSRTNA